MRNKLMKAKQANQKKTEQLCQGTPVQIHKYTGKYKYTLITEVDNPLPQSTVTNFKSEKSSHVTVTSEFAYRLSAFNEGEDDRQVVETTSDGRRQRRTTSLLKSSSSADSLRVRLPPTVAILAHRSPAGSAAHRRPLYRQTDKDSLSTTRSESRRTSAAVFEPCSCKRQFTPSPSSPVYK